MLSIRDRRDCVCAVCQFNSLLYSAPDNLLVERELDDGAPHFISAKIQTHFHVLFIDLEKCAF